MSNTLADFLWENGGSCRKAPGRDSPKGRKKARKVQTIVRSDREWNAGHIDGAVHIHGGTLQERFSEVPRDRPVAVICGSGYRGSIAASFLQRHGYPDGSNVVGGMSAWKAADLPTV